MAAHITGRNRSPRRSGGTRFSNGRKARQRKGEEMNETKMNIYTATILILAIIGMVQSREEKNKKRSTIALICSIVAPIVYIVLYFVFVFALLLLAM